MELKEFLQKFSPDYNDIEKEALTVEKEACNLAGTPYTEDERNLAKYQLLVRCFPAALQNFADKICEKQNQCCADFIAERLDDHETEPFEGGIYVDASDVLCYVEQAKIDEL
jgi:hypothetical protein